MGWATGARRALGVTAVVGVLAVAGTAAAGTASAATPAPANPLAALLGSVGSLASNLVSATGINLFAPVGSDYSPADDPGSLYNLTSDLGARSLWLRGITGGNVSVALVDSGVSAVPGVTSVLGADLSSTAGTAAAGTDGFGHGTAMAGIIAGSDDGSLLGGASSFQGIAPDATLVNLKVAEANGWTDPSRVIAAIAWAIQHKNDPGRPPIRVLNLSYGTASTQGYQADPVAYAVEQAWKAGIVVVASAGNDGTSDGKLLDPAMDPYVIAVGAATTDDTSGAVASFSNRGDGTRNPDVVADGTAIQTLRAPGSLLDSLVPSKSGSRYITGSGTSEAAAEVSGIVALLLSQRPNLTPDQVKAMLTGTALPLLRQPASAQGHGLVQLASAASLLFVPRGTQSYPASLGNGSLDASRGPDSWIAAGATPAQAENPALMGGPTGTAWAGRTWAGRTWAGSAWAADGTSPGLLCGRTWAGRTWAGGSWT